MFQRNVMRAPSILRSLRFMCSSNEKAPTGNGFIKKGVSKEATTTDNRFIKEGVSKETTTTTENRFIKEGIPDVPFVEYLGTTAWNVETHLTCKKVTYGEYEFFECNEGFVLCYINAYEKLKEPHDVFYGVYYGAGHPLNTSGPLSKIQTMPHAKYTAVLHAIEMFPESGPKKLCICTDCTRTLKMICRLQMYNENGFRSSRNGKVLHTKDTLEAVARAIALRDDVQLRLMWTASDIIRPMREARNLALAESRASRSSSR